jgi:hypothetical protein
MKFATINLEQFYREKIRKDIKMKDFENFR